MRADFSDGIAAVEWADAQFPVLGDRFREWWTTNVQLVATDKNPPLGKISAVVRAKEPLPAIFSAEAGAIIGSFRSALDLLAAALARRNGITPSRETHFPVYVSAQESVDPLYGIERKKWLSPSEVHLVKNLCPYRGGNELLWSLHQLDIVRKHERLIVCTVHPRIEFVLGRRVSFPDGMTNLPVYNLEDEPTLFEFPRDTAKPEAQFRVDIAFDEVGLPAVHRRPVFEILIELRDFVRDVIQRFDGH